jgi:hypothetical protein
MRQADKLTVPELYYSHFTARNNRNTRNPSNHDMDELLFELAFSGQIHDDAKLDEVKARIARMFKADEGTIARLFSGERIVIKKNMTAEAADKYSIAFTKAGAICEMALMPEGSTRPAPADARATNKATSSASVARADKGASSNQGLGKVATISAIAVVVVAALVAAFVAATN